jgi:hypothetical protein
MKQGGTAMVITLDPELEAALNDVARQKGIAPEALAVQALRQGFLAPTLTPPQEEWEQLLRSTGTDCGVSLSNEAVSSEGLYD